MGVLFLLMLFLGFMVKIIHDGCINAMKRIWVIWGWGEEERLGSRRGMFTVPKYGRVTG